MKATLFVPCLVDRFLPLAGVAATKLLESVGVTVQHDARQTCCGQPALNAGHPDLALPLARKVLKLFADRCEPLVIPSGSCAAMIKEGFGLLDLSEADTRRWARLRDRVFELSGFLYEKGLTAKVKPIPGTNRKSEIENRKSLVLLHRTCHHLRHMKGGPGLDALLQRLEGFEIVKRSDSDDCCGFGGVFSTKLPELSIAIARRRVESAAQSGADWMALADAGCILHLHGVMQAMGIDKPRIVHYAQLFTGDGLES